MDQFLLEVALRSLEFQERSVIRVVDRAGRYLAISITVTVSFLLSGVVAPSPLMTGGVVLLVVMALLALTVYAFIDNAERLAAPPKPGEKLWQYNDARLRRYFESTHSLNDEILARDTRRLRCLQSIVAVQLLVTLAVAALEVGLR